MDGESVGVGRRIPKGQAVSDPCLTCTICSKVVKDEADLCPNLVCRTCHKSITFEECLADYDRKEDIWWARFGDEMKRYGVVRQVKP